MVMCCIILHITVCVIIVYMCCIILHMLYCLHVLYHTAYVLYVTLHGKTYLSEIPLKRRKKNGRRTDDEQFIKPFERFVKPQ